MPTLAHEPEQLLKEEGKWEAEPSARVRGLKIVDRCGARGSALINSCLVLLCVLLWLDMEVTWTDHARTTGTALKNWFVAQCYDSAAVALLWLVGLLIIGIPWAPVWAILAGILQFVPHVGGPLALVIPAILGAFSHDHMRFFYVMILFAAIMVTDGFFLQPYFMRRTAKVPFWAALLTPIAVVLLVPFWWAVLLAPPLLAVIFAFRRKHQSEDLATKDTKEHQGR